MIFLLLAILMFVIGLLVGDRDAGTGFIFIGIGCMAFSLLTGI